MQDVGGDGEFLYLALQSLLSRIAVEDRQIDGAVGLAGVGLQDHLEDKAGLSDAAAKQTNSTH